MVAKASRGTWWFFVLLVILLVGIWYAVAAARTDECSEDFPREFQWFPPQWECDRRL